MLLELRVTNFAVIDSLQVHFLRPGLNVLSGETGAGKSILIKSLALLRGGKASPEMIRVGRDQAVIEGAFDLSLRPDVVAPLEEAGFDMSEPLLVVRRILSATGKHRLYINGSLATLNQVEEIMEGLVEITGQHEHHSLSRKAAQLEILDEYGELLNLREKYHAAYMRSGEIASRIEELQACARDRDMRVDFLKFQVQEIDQFKPVAGEEKLLEAELQRTTHSARLLKFAQSGESTLYSDDDAVLARLASLLNEGTALADIDPSLRDSVENLKQARVLLEEAAYSLRKYGQGVDADEERLEEVRSRLAQFRKLQKKYGASSEEITAFRNAAFAELQNLENAESNIKDLENELARVRGEMAELGRSLTSKRRKCAETLAREVNKELMDLNMKGVIFSVEIVEAQDFGSTGHDDVSFMIQPSSKDSPRPVNKIASGGEMSRLMLAIKQVVSTGDLPMTYLFDEVDAGVSGPTAEKVGRKLKHTGTQHQVVCITHLPQVAAYADAHFLIVKQSEKGMVRSEVVELGPEERVAELARMISGEKTTQSSLAHAREMLADAARAKKNAGVLSGNRKSPRGRPEAIR